MKDTEPVSHQVGHGKHRIVWLVLAGFATVFLVWYFWFGMIVVDAGSSVLGSITNSSGQPLAGVLVTLEAPGGAVDSTLSDGRGCFSVFTLHAPRKGEIRLHFAKAELGRLERVAVPGDYTIVAMLGTGIGGDTGTGQLVPVAPCDTVNSECIPIQ